MSAYFTVPLPLPALGMPDATLPVFQFPKISLNLKNKLVYNKTNTKVPKFY
jgi:hypothetical protein